MEEDHIVIEEQDRPFEEELIRNPHSVKSWLRYISMKAKSPPKVVYMLYERAVKQLPGSYKLWYRYLRLRRVHSRFITRTRHAFDRALKALPITQHDRIWNLYLRFADRHGDKINETCVRIYRRYVKVSDAFRFFWFCFCDSVKVFAFLDNSGFCGGGGVCVLRRCGLMLTV
ncbi:unnamed protein product [Trichobilharzia regenti]|nr:unnamed protein product [Trichobilharzia regenti]